MVFIANKGLLVTFYSLQIIDGAVSPQSRQTCICLNFSAKFKISKLIKARLHNFILRFEDKSKLICRMTAKHRLKDETKIVRAFMP